MIQVTRFDRKKADDFLVAVRAGASNDVAAQHAAIPVAVVREWFDRKPDFKEEVEKARADLGLFAVGVVRRDVGRDPDKPNVSAAQWLAEKAAGDAELERLRALTT